MPPPLELSDVDHPELDVSDVHRWVFSLRALGLIRYALIEVVHGVRVDHFDERVGVSKQRAHGMLDAVATYVRRLPGNPDMDSFTAGDIVVRLAARVEPDELDRVPVVGRTFDLETLASAVRVSAEEIADWEYPIRLWARKDEAVAVGGAIAEAVASAKAKPGRTDF